MIRDIIPDIHGQADKLTGLLSKLGYRETRGTWRHPEAEAEMMGDILEEDEGRFSLSDDAGDMGPEVAGIVRALALASHAERLARVARSDDVHSITPRAAVEGGNVVPERRRRQGLVLHPRHEDGRGISVPFDMTDSSISGAGDVEAELEPTGARAEREAEQGFVSGRQSGGRYSHAIHCLSAGCRPYRQRSARFLPAPPAGPSLPASV